MAKVTITIEDRNDNTEIRWNTFREPPLGDEPTTPADELAFTIVQTVFEGKEDFGEKG